MSDVADAVDAIEQATDAMDNLTKYQKRQEAYDKRQEDAHALHALEVNSVIRHRGAVEGFLASQVETNREYNAIVVGMVRAQERQAAALESIARSMELRAEPVTFVKLP